MTTGPMGRLKTGMTIDGEWLVEDVFRVQPGGERVWVLRHLTRKIQRYLDSKGLCKLFTGKPGR